MGKNIQTKKAPCEELIVSSLLNHELTVVSHIFLKSWVRFHYLRYLHLAWLLRDLLNQEITLFDKVKQAKRQQKATHHAMIWKDSRTDD